MAADPKATTSRLIDGAPDSPEDSRSARINQILLRRRRKFVRAREWLLDTTATAFLLVLNPDKLSILESRKALDLLEQFHVPVSAVVVNRILPDEADGEFLRARRLQEEKYRSEIDREFARLPRIVLPLLPHDVYGRETLRRLGQMLGNTDR